ncbi:MAG: D-alanine--D-alanine ligase (EC [uncultured Thiotrichaceae bacterium]|uniref:D-alanine--D-alanine ligase (EC) n=1 Tax=uncultured Thiotrichaceae bacterium TaxID=298394 RepID=A0A6S6TWY6_9GAMM|nr:MAG: D-alanine--D-alanine ligase (EC [uncultured Thiotrichaceae bacterium]
MNIEIITTPNDTLKESGFGSLNACNSVLNAIKALHYSVRLNVCTTEENLAEIVKRRPDLVILAVKYIPVKEADDIWLSDYFSQHKINYTGSKREVLRFDSNKVLAKTHLINKGIKTANYFIAAPGQFKKESDLPVVFPLFLKPLDAANGNGIDDLSFVTHFKDYESKVASLYAAFDQPTLVEEYLDGREFTVAIIRTANKRLSVSAVEVIPPTSAHGLRILGAQTKKDDSEKLIKIVDHEVKNKVATLAIAAFNALGVRDYGRVDIKTNNHGECFFMEVNLVPGMTKGSSYFPEACEIAHKFTYEKVIELLISGGIARAATTTPPHTQRGYNKSLATAI